MVRISCTESASTTCQRFSLGARHRQVAIIHYGLDRAPGGIGRYTVELTRALIQMGVDVTVLHAGGAEGSHDGVISLPGVRRLPWLLTLGQIAIGWHGWRQKMALIHDSTGSAPLFLTPTRRIATIHDVVPYVHPETSTLLERLIYRCWLPIVVRRLHGVITDSNQSRRDILRYLPVEPARVVVIPLATSSHYRPLPREAITVTLQRCNIDFPYILYVGSLEPRKNLSRLLRAYAHLRRWTSHWQLVVVGARKRKPDTILDSVHGLELEPYVHFTGYVEEDDLPALYNGADCFAFPSLYEGFGLPVLEAMACGTPVVTSNRSSLPEVTGGAALLVDPYDVEQIAHGLWLVLTQPALAAKMREKGLARAEMFSWERTARETAAVYQRVLCSG